MPTSTKHLENSTSKLEKIGKRATELYPEIKWVLQVPLPGITDDYGDGFILIGQYEDSMATYFILHEDPRKDNWIHMIASQVKED